ncbi:MAG TPA: SURF1 family protein, partial [Burkholderiales bacterium]|nr:SURF1 family protein [Burkholderiales bacterium]
MPAGYSFRPRLRVLAAAALGCAAGIAAAQWQAGRAEEKRAAAAHLERASVRGVFEPRYTVLLDNKVRRGQPGYEVLTPLKLTAADYVLVNRGWIAAPARRDVLPEVRTPPGPVSIEGVALERLPRVLERDGGAGKVRQTLDIAAYAAETGLRLQPRIIEQHS